MFNISLSDTLRHQLREQGYKFIDDVDVSWFEEILLDIDRLYVTGYTTETEYKKIRERFLDDLKKFVTKKLRIKNDNQRNSIKRYIIIRLHY